MLLNGLRQEPTACCSSGFVVDRGQALVEAPHLLGHQVAARQLADIGDRQSIAELDAPGLSVGRQLVLQEAFQLAGFQRLAVAQLDIGLDDLAALLVGHAADHGFRDRGCRWIASSTMRG